MKYLSRFSSTLTKLYSTRNNIGVNGMRYLEEGKYNNLSVLYLYNNNIGDEGIEYFDKQGYLMSLNILDLPLNKIRIEMSKQNDLYFKRA